MSRCPSSKSIARPMASRRCIPGGDIVALATDRRPRYRLPRMALNDADAIAAFVIDLPSIAGTPMLSFEQALESLLAAAQPVAEIRHVPLTRRRRPRAGRRAAVDRGGAAARQLRDGRLRRALRRRARGRRLPAGRRSAFRPAASARTLAAAARAARIFTGAPMPPGADAVVMQELCEHDGDAVSSSTTLPRPGENIRRAGEDIAAGARNPRGRHPAAAAGDRRWPPRSGLPELPVFRRAARRRVLHRRRTGACRASRCRRARSTTPTAITLRGLLEGLGCEVSDLGIVPDKLAGDARGAARRGRRQRPDRHQRRRLGRRGRPRQGRGRGRGQPRICGRSRSSRASRWPSARSARTRRTAAFHRPAGQPGVELRHLPDRWCGRSCCSCRACAGLAPRALPLRADFDWPRPDARREFLRARLNG